MKKMLILGCFITVTTLINAETSEKNDDNRLFHELIQTSSQENTPTFLKRCSHIAKGIGIGGFSLLCGLFCISNARGIQQAGIFYNEGEVTRKMGLVGVTIFALLLAADSGVYSLRNFREALR